MDKLAGLHPKLKRAVEQVLAEMAAAGHPMMVTDGVRTTLEQQRLWRQGRSLPGPNVRPGHPLGDKVTNADGITHKSNHQLHADGCGHAVDCAFLDEAGHPSWDLSHPWSAYGAAGKALGLVWGGDWSSIHDLPHLELPDGVPATGASHA